MSIDILVAGKNNSVPGGEPARPGDEMLVRRPNWKRLALAFGVAAVSDGISLVVDPILPLQWLVDVGTAILLFLILGRRWALLPGLIAEAIPGVGLFPVWLLVVVSILFYDDIRKTKA